MKKIADRRRLLGVTEKASLDELKSVYRDMIKAWHPDKFTEEERKLEAEEKSRHIIDAYHFLVSVAPETKEQNLAEYTETITKSYITDLDYKGQILQVKFMDGSSYEYYGVPKAIYVKLVNSDAQARFARRHIFNSFVYRNIAKKVDA
ncbi:MAG: KTSC domain-containing protein [Flavipsychrobacter sp.]|nr:KTSC domain-containing protein [Flavipsychrobacter sp.]